MNENKKDMFTFLIVFILVGIAYFCFLHYVIDARFNSIKPSYVESEVYNGTGENLRE